MVLLHEPRLVNARRSTTEVRRGDDGIAAWYRLDGREGRLLEGRAEAVAQFSKDCLLD